MTREELKLMSKEQVFALLEAKLHEQYATEDEHERRQHHSEATVMFDHLNYQNPDLGLEALKIAQKVAQECKA